jgi:hypothetical protein
MKQQLLFIITGLAVVLVLGLFALSYRYLSTDYRTFAILASDPTPADLRQKLGEPNEVIPAGQDLTQRGWPLPRVKRSAEIWIYGSRTGRNFYVSINKEQDRIEYVFSSSS